VNWEQVYDDSILQLSPITWNPSQQVGQEYSNDMTPAMTTNLTQELYRIDAKLPKTWLRGFNTNGG